MKKIRRLSVLPLLLLLLVFIVPVVLRTKAQVKYHSDELNISIKGTSSLQPWELKSNKGELEAVFGIGKNDRVTGLYSLWFTVESQSLKSGEAAMENSAYKTLKAKDFDNISFVLKSSTVTPGDSNTYEIKCLGFLTVAGTEKETELIVNVKINDDKSLTCMGTKKLKFTDFNLKPPTGGLGTVKAGDEILIAYNLNLGKRS